MSGATPRATYRVLSFDEKGHGVAGDSTYDGFRFTFTPGAIDVGDKISGEPGIPDATFLEDIIIEDGRNAQGERKRFQSQGDGITNNRVFGTANTDIPHVSQINRDEDIKGAWMTSQRRAWMGDYLYALKKDGIIEAWSWATDEKDFFIPMTKPALTEDQQTMMAAEYVQYIESSK